MATTPAVTKAMEEKATGISGIMDIVSNPAKKIGNAEAIDLSIFAENIRLNSRDKRSPSSEAVYSLGDSRRK